MIRKMTAVLVLLIGIASVVSCSRSELTKGFENPPQEAKPWVFWWWLQSNVSKAGITRDLEEMKSKGIAGALIFDAGTAVSQWDRIEKTPAGPTFMSPEWRELFKYSLKEANRLGIEISVNLCSGWDAGGKWITPEYACQKHVWSAMDVEGPLDFDKVLPMNAGMLVFNTGDREKPHPRLHEESYRDIAVLAFLTKDSASGRGIMDLDFKAGRREPYYKNTFRNHSEEKGEQDTEKGSVVDLSAKMDQSGRLVWHVPKGNWTILRFGYTLLGTRTSTISLSSMSTSLHERDNPLEMDWLSRRAMDFHFAATGKKLIEDAGDLAGSTLKYLHDDSWEVGFPNWTESFREDFKKFRGYDLLPYLPVLAGKVVDSREVSNRFLRDYRRTLADCLAENHYGRFSDLCEPYGIGTDCQSGGPAAGSTDTLANLGNTDIPHGEFWLNGEKKQSRVGKQTASAAHIYGRKWAAAEAFTSIGPHWEESPFDLKECADKAFCEGTNRFYMHTFTHSPPEVGRPGYEYFAGTHFNPNITWWPQAGAWTDYIARCQFLLSRGLFVGDVCYYYGDNTPIWVPAKHIDPSLGYGYDYDVCNSEVILTRMSVKDNRIVLPDGMSYRLLVLPAGTDVMPLNILRKLKQLVEDGATVVGPKPQRTSGLRNYPQCDKDVQKLGNELWGNCDGQKVKQHKYGKGRIVWGRSLRDLLQEDAIMPDFEYQCKNPDLFLDFIHRRVDDTDIYFVCNWKGQAEEALCSFRVTGKQPELWNPITGQTRPATAFKQNNGTTTLPLEFASYDSVFVVFREDIPKTQNGKAKRNFPKLKQIQELTGPWTVKFDPKWGGPESVVFEKLEDWIARPENGIKHYSGKATYHKKFDLPKGSSGLDKRLYLNLNGVKNIAEVRLNGKDLGVVWTAPWRVDITQAAKPTGNKLEIDVVNLWPNRLIGDAGLPSEKRLTETNVRKFNKNSRLRSSGLLGPITVSSTIVP